jgi:hypothetical protein
MTSREDRLSINQISKIINKAESSYRHEECATCECYLGFLTQLEIDADQEGRQFLKDFMPHREEIHACLGCDPCPPGILYTDYLRKKAAGRIDLSKIPKS